jgi:hypothetical protein
MELDDTTPKLRPIPRNRKPVPVVVDAKFLPKFDTTVKPPTFAPLIDIDGYIRDARLTDDEEKLYRELYTPKHTNESEPPEKLCVPSDLLTIFTSTKVLKSGQVRVKITVPMEPVHVYEKKGKLAPIDVRIRAAKGFGYPESVLSKMLENHDKRKVRLEKLDEFINVVFEKYMSSKTNKPKKKTVQESLNSKLKKKPIKKYA